MPDGDRRFQFLECALHTFNLALEMARQFHSDHQRADIVPEALVRDQKTIDVLSSRLIGLRENIREPPEGLGDVGDALTRLARLVRAMRTSVATPEGRTWLAYQESWPELNSICHDGISAIGAARRHDATQDPFEFLDKTSPAPLSTPDMQAKSVAELECTPSSREAVGIDDPEKETPWDQMGGMLSHVEIAKIAGVDQERLRKRLDRWRKRNGEGWREVMDRKPREPRYLYSPGAVSTVVEQLRTASAEESGERPAN